MKEAVIVSAVRTPVGSFRVRCRGLRGRGWARWRCARRCAAPASNRRAEVPDECIMGCVLQAGLGQNPARQAAIYGGLSSRPARLP